MVPPNSVRLILNQWTELKEKFDEYQPLYDRFKKYFGYLNTGYVGKQHEIFAYNGGLFAPDEVLDAIIINDEILYSATLGLSNYDYNSEVDVNILGHIFEHSLTEIEELEKEITTTKDVEAKASKRKKDGVFYTPKYITKYIVENTLGTLCTNKKAALNLQEEDYHSLTKKAKKQLFDNLMQYREWLLHITIIDPACGSGAFLNQALEFLIAEHKWISELEANIFNTPMVFDVESSILENNLFGVDINEESVEIAKLSLWLRTAQKGRKLNSLNNNIKCGNSLISDPAVAGDKAFNWYTAFPKIFSAKEKYAYHVVLTTHNSRTSQRMQMLGIVKGKPAELSLKQEEALANIFKDLIIENKYKCLAFNVCKDHVHLILVCGQHELTGIVQKLKSISSKLFNRWCVSPMDFIPPMGSIPPMGHDPLEYNDPLESNNPLESNSVPPMGHDPLEYDNDPLEYDNNPLEYDNDPLESNNDPSESNNAASEYNPSEHNNHLWSQKFFSANMDDWELMELSNKPGHVYKATYTQNAIEYINNNRHKHNLPISATLEKTITQFVCTEDEAFTTEYEGGFDVVIGNPPYGAKLSDLEKIYIRNTYISMEGEFDTYIYFLENMLNLGKSNCEYGYIIPNNILQQKFGRKIRELLLKKCKINYIIDLGHGIFSDAVVPTAILIFKKSINTFDSNFVFYNQNILENDFNINIKSIQQRDFLENENFQFNLNVNIEEKQLLNKLDSKAEKLKNVCELKIGIEAAPHFIFDAPISEYSKPLIRGRNFNKYFIDFESDPKYIEYIKEKLHRPREERLFVCDKKLLIRQTGDRIICTLDENRLYAWKSVFVILCDENKINLKYLMVLLNSSTINFYYQKIVGELGRTFAQVKGINLDLIPIKFISLYEQMPFIEKADKMLSKNKELQQANTHFQKLLTAQFPTLNINTKLEKWYTLSFADFNKELTKQKIKLTLPQQSDWLSFFEQQQQKALAIKNEIDTTDAEIDKMVYALYGLTEEEVRIVEGG